MRVYGNPSKDLMTKKYRRRDLGSRVKPMHEDRWFKRAARLESRLEIKQQLSDPTFEQIELEIFNEFYRHGDAFIRDILMDELDREFEDWWDSRETGTAYSDHDEYGKHTYQSELEAWEDFDEYADLL